MPPSRLLPAPARIVAPASAPGLHVLLLTRADDSLSRRAHVALTAAGHRVTVADSVDHHQPELVISLDGTIPATAHRCLVVENELGAAIERQASQSEVWVTCGDVVVARRSFALREASRASVYRHEFRRAAIEALLEAIHAPDEAREPRPPIGAGQPVSIDWTRHTTATIIRRIRTEAVSDEGFQPFGAQREYRLRGAPGQIIAQRHGAICRATVDGAVWISHLRRAGHFTLPATRALELAGRRVSAPEAGDGFREIAYEEAAGVGYLHFDFHNGAISTEQCGRALAAVRAAKTRDTRVLVLMGGHDVFCNGIELNVIEAADDPAAETWRNLLALDELVRELIETDDRLVLSALTGDAGAGGVALALAADEVSARADIVLSPYHASGLTAPPFRALGAHQALELGLIDHVGAHTAEAFTLETRRWAEALARDPRTAERIVAKQCARAWDEARPRFVRPCCER